MKPATIAEVRPVRADDGHLLLASCAWVAIDTKGRRFGGDTADHARRLATSYNHPPRKAGAAKDRP